MAQEEPGARKGWGGASTRPERRWEKRLSGPNVVHLHRTRKDAAGETVIRQEGALEDSEGSRAHCPQDMQQEESERRALTVALEAQPSPSCLHPQQ